MALDSNAGIHKLRAASCSVLLLLLTLALVASSLLVARYAVQASSWWLSLLAVTVCLLGLCTWIQLAASRAGRWRTMLARQIALSRAQAAHAAARAFAPDLYGPQCGGGVRCPATVSTIPVECNMDCQTALRVSGPPPPPPYALPDLPDLPPSYCVATDTPAPAPSAPVLEPPPPYAVAIRRDSLVQSSTTSAAMTSTTGPAGLSDVISHNNTVINFSINGGSSSSVVVGSSNRNRNARVNVASRRPILWF